MCIAANLKKKKKKILIFTWCEVRALHFCIAACTAEDILTSCLVLLLSSGVFGRGDIGGGDLGMTKLSTSSVFSAWEMCIKNRQVISLK